MSAIMISRVCQSRRTSARPSLPSGGESRRDDDQGVADQGVAPGLASGLVFSLSVGRYQDNSDVNEAIQRAAKACRYPVRGSAQGTRSRERGYDGALSQRRHGREARHRAVRRPTRLAVPTEPEPGAAPSLTLRDAAPVSQSFAAPCSAGRLTFALPSCWRAETACVGAHVCTSEVYVNVSAPDFFRHASKVRCGAV